MEEITYWVNGKFVPESQATIPLNSRGYRLGDGVFDTERTFNGQIFRLDAHLERLGRSLAFTRIDLGMSLEELGRVSEEAVRRNEHLRARHGDWWVTQTVSRHGSGAFVSVIVEPLPSVRNAPLYSEGLSLRVPAVRTSGNAGLDPKVKATSRLGMVLADLETKAGDPDAWTLLLDEAGDLTEVLFGNLFLARGGKLLTPPVRAILSGVTRDTTISLAQGLGLSVEEARLQPYDLYTADEAFVTSTSYCVLPVRDLNGAPVGKAVPGPLTQQLLAAWSKQAGFDIAEQARQVAAQAAPTPLASARN